MLTFLLVVHSLLALGIIGLVILQRNEDDGFVSPALMTGGTNVRGSSNFLTRFTSIMMIMFVTNCLVIGRIVTKARNINQIEKSLSSTEVVAADDLDPKLSPGVILNAAPNATPAVNAPEVAEETYLIKKA